MTKIFEGRNEQEAIENASEELGLGIDQFEVEIIDTEQKKGLFFKKPNVKIKVHYDDTPLKTVDKKAKTAITSVVANEIEQKSIHFLEKIVEYMGFNGTVNVISREEGKFTLDIECDHASILIGKKGKNLDALQLIANVYLTTLLGEDDDVRVVVDAENYRERREEAIIRTAMKSADAVVRNKSSRLLEPMNPYERRLVHTALGDRTDVITQSEGEGLYKQVRILYKGSRGGF